MTNRATTECNQTELPFTSSQNRKVEARFDGGDISSDGGLLLLREVDRKLNVLSRAAKLLDDPRDTGKVRHSAQSLLKQRVMAIAQGYEDLNDHDLLRNDSLLQLAADKTAPLASPPTLCRMEHWADRHSAMRLNKLLIELFIESSVTKAGVTQLARVAALELAPFGVRVNTLHPDAVFDTELWTDEALEKSATRYGMTMQEYKTKNLLHTEIKSTDVALLVSTVAGPAFSATTGAQIPIDGGNDRVI